ncbi:MAG TPA: hypothetical protein VEP90_28510 [Methylomirabilota bacterium]|nr:hypothetical protein [Methylomirabilota bacterium]
MKIIIKLKKGTSLPIAIDLKEHVDDVLNQHGGIPEMEMTYLEDDDGIIWAPVR